MSHVTVFTNGVFDLLPVGHARLIAYAASLGTRLIVGINSDMSVRRLKGNDRPIQPESDRAEILLRLKGVTEVIVFVDDTPEMLVRKLRPDVLVKGPEAACQDLIPGAAFVKAYGGRVEVPAWVVEHSTTAIIERILQVHRTLF